MNVRTAIKWQYLEELSTCSNLNRSGWQTVRWTSLLLFRHGLKYSRKCSKTYECEEICKSTAAGICVLVWATMSAVLSLVTGTVIFCCQARTRKLYGDRWTWSFVWQIGIFAHYVVTVYNTWLASSVTHTQTHITFPATSCFPSRQSQNLWKASQLMNSQLLRPSGLLISPNILHISNQIKTSTKLAWQLWVRLLTQYASSSLTRSDAVQREEPCEWRSQPWS